MLHVLVFVVSLGARAIRVMCRRRADLVIENLALRQQVTALKQERPRPPLDAMDLFTVPTVSFRLLYGFFVIEHGRRHIVHFNATFHPTSAWVMQQLREAFPYDTAPRYLVFDRDSLFSPAVVEFTRAMGTKPVRISYRGPWQNGTAERWIGNCRREMLEHVVALSERHLVRLVRLHISYYHEDRCHLGLDKDTPNERPVTPMPSPRRRSSHCHESVDGTMLRMARGCVAKFPAAPGAPSLDIPGAPESALRVNPTPSLRRLTWFRRRFSLRVVVRPRRINNDEAQLWLRVGIVSDVPCFRRTRRAEP